ncbi:hypothetical protein [Chryseobacterium sp. RU37D]|uniref:hypothetical protein n=1 Tax=Chryseobacterium sp. RU37D TaxID=1907397 RepID=UPI00117D83DF|nr:hypothetical protein [Chryseobacterium sp. RU37D]
MYDYIDIRKKIIKKVFMTTFQETKVRERSVLENYERFSINFHEFAEILQKRIEDYIDRKKILIEDIDDYSHYVDNVEMFEDPYIAADIFKKETPDPYLIEYYQYYNIKDFFEVKEIVSSEGIRYIISFNEITYKNFEYSIPKIFKFLKDKIYKKSLKPKDKKEEHIIPAIPAPLPEPKNNKIRIHGSTQLFGYIFSELIRKGYIAPEKKQGNVNVAATARLILDHFEFLDTEKQPEVDYLRKALFEQNSLSSEKQNQFTIPPFNRVK